MCTEARLVQGGKASEWAGHGTIDETEGDFSFRVEPGQPAYLEVTIDPTAHGPKGVGPFLRYIIVTTSEGQDLQFTMTGTIVR